MSRATAIESARAIMASALGVSLLYSQQALADGFRKTSAYATLDAIADTAAGSVPRAWMSSGQADPGLDPDGDGETEYLPMTMAHYQRRRTTLQVAYFGSGAADALSGLRLALNKDTVRASLRAANIGLRAVGDTVEDNDARRDTTWEPAATQDFHLFWVATAAEDLHPIETITSTETLNPPS